MTAQVSGSGTGLVTEMFVVSKSGVITLPEMLATRAAKTPPLRTSSDAPELMA